MTHEQHRCRVTMELGNCLGRTPTLRAFCVQYLCTVFHADLYGLKCMQALNGLHFMYPFSAPINLWMRNLLWSRRTLRFLCTLGPLWIIFVHKSYLPFIVVLAPPWVYFVVNARSFTWFARNWWSTLWCISLVFYAFFFLGASVVRSCKQCSLNAKRRIY